jgi:hypothetical protein
MADHRVPYYRVPESELDSPGVVGRRVEITAGGTNWSAGDQLVDTGSSWELVSPGYGSAKADDSVIKRSDRQDFSDFWPHPVRGEERSGPLNIQPHPAASNPVITGSDVTDKSNVISTADPFLAVEEGGDLHLFCEAIHDDDGDGNDEYSIVHFTSSDGVAWTYDQAVIDNGETTIAYPYVFKFEGTWYMTPNLASSEDRVDLYKADNFPSSWSVVETLASGDRYGDPTLVYHDPDIHNWGPSSEKWFMFYQNGAGNLSIASSDSLVGGTWTTDHAGDIGGQPPSGRPIVTPEYVDLFTRTTDQTKLNYYRYTTLAPSATTRAETANSPIAQIHRGKDSWASQKLHHIDPLMATVAGPDVVALDGQQFGQNGDWIVAIYTTGQRSQAAARYLFDTTGTQSISDQTFTTLAFDAPATDDIGHDVGENIEVGNDRYVVPKSGFYRVHLTVNWTSVTGSPFRTITEIHLNGSRWDGAQSNDQFNQDNGMSTTTELEGWLSGGDEIDFVVWQNSGVTIDVDQNSSYFIVERKPY